MACLLTKLVKVSLFVSKRKGHIYIVNKFCKRYQILHKIQENSTTKIH